MPQTPIIVLMGLRGSGKSTVGRLVADRIDVPFLDLDDRTAERLGVASPAEAIDTLGFDAFRRAEAGALRESLETGPLVLALGGGTPTAPGAADRLGAHTAAGGRLIYLHAPPDVLRRRLAGTDTRTRPSLTGGDTLDEIDAVYLRRDPLYRELCTELIETADRSPRQIARLIG